MIQSRDVMINDYYHLRGGGQGVYQEVQSNHVGRAYNDCNGSTLYINYHE